MPEAEDAPSLRPIHPVQLDVGGDGDRHTLETMVDHVGTQGWNPAQLST